MKKIHHEAVKEQLKKLIRKIVEQPHIGKPMRYEKKGTREVYAGSFRLSYHYDEERAYLTFLDFYHKDEQ